MIDVKNVNYQYKTQQMQFNFSVNASEQVMILGPSGAGKSTLLSLIAGFIQPTQGEIWLNGQNKTEAPPNVRPVSMVFQDNNLFTHLTVEQNIALGMSPSLKLSFAQQQELTKIVKRIGLSELLSRYPEQLSGGQRQRVAIGRCLVQRRPILLLDEPFSSLDPKLKKEMFTLLNEVQQEYQLTTLMVTHQLEDIGNTNNRCFVIIDGKIEFDGDYQQLKNNTQISASLGIG